jgi:hypothetical protein
VSLSKISCAKKNSMGYAKKRKKNIHAKRHERKKCMPKEHEEKKRKREYRNKDSPYFQIRGIHPKKREIHDSKEYQKYLELGIS